MAASRGARKDSRSTVRSTTSWWTRIEDSVERAVSLGAKVTKGKTAVPGMGWFAMFTDPEGNNFAVFKADAAAK